MGTTTLSFMGMKHLYVCGIAQSAFFFYGNESPLCLWDCPVSRLDGWFGKEEMGRAAWVYLTPMARRWVDTLHTLWIHVLLTYMYLSFGLPAPIFPTLPGSLACWLACFHKHTHTQHHGASLLGSGGRSSSMSGRQRQAATRLKPTRVR